jgi:hypothetical protein
VATPASGVRVLPKYKPMLIRCKISERAHDINDEVCISLERAMVDDLGIAIVLQGH